MDSGNTPLRTYPKNREHGNLRPLGFSKSFSICFCINNGHFGQLTHLNLLKTDKVRKVLRRIEIFFQAEFKNFLTLTGSLQWPCERVVLDRVG